MEHAEMKTPAELLDELKAFLAAHVTDDTVRVYGDDVPALFDLVEELEASLYVSVAVRTGEDFRPRAS